MDFETAEQIRLSILEQNDPETASVLLGTLFQERPDVYEALHMREIAPGVHKRNPGPDAAMMTERYVSGVGNAGSRYVEGMQAPRRSPKEAALRAEGKYEDRVKQAISEKRYSKGIRSYDLAEAVQIATADGGRAYVDGAQKRQAKVGRVFQRLAPLLGGVSQAIQNMPQDTDQQRETRLLQARRLMINVGKQLKTG